VGWILCSKYHRTRYDLIPEFAVYPELRWLVRWHYIPPTLLGVAVFLVGGWSALLIGFFLSTVLLWHGTFLVNSVAHVFGRRRFVTTDTSRNSFLIALFTSGEGWHNNHHYYQKSMRNGFFWWEWDPSFYVVRALSWIGLASDLRSAPPALLERSRVRNNWDVGMHGPEPKPVAAARQKASEMAHLLIDSAKATRERRPVPTPAD
jgi:stearoyl-CoA desaturase (delta-9 desaturase)